MYAFIFQKMYKKGALYKASRDNTAVEKQPRHTIG